MIWRNTVDKKAIASLKKLTQNGHALVDIMNKYLIILDETIAAESAPMPAAKKSAPKVVAAKKPALKVKAAKKPALKVEAAKKAPAKKLAEKKIVVKKVPAKKVAEAPKEAVKPAPKAVVKKPVAVEAPKATKRGRPAKQKK